MIIFIIVCITHISILLWTYYYKFELKTLIAAMLMFLMLGVGLSPVAWNSYCVPWKSAQRLGCFKGTCRQTRGNPFPVSEALVTSYSRWGLFFFEQLMLWQKFVNLLERDGQTRLGQHARHVADTPWGAANATRLSEVGRQGREILKRVSKTLLVLPRIESHS